jgi:hypothetical protein
VWRLSLRWYAIARVRNISENLDAGLSAVGLILNANDVSLIRMMQQQLMSGYVPNDTIVDWVYLEQLALGFAG